MGERLHRFGGRSDENSGFHDNQKLSLTYNGENVVRSITTSFLVGASSILQVTRTSIKPGISSISGQIGLFTLESLALERRKIFPQTYNGENVVRMIAKFSDEFECRRDQTIHFRVTCP